jgi:F-type H+-transporting ATPase subunit delta
VISSAVFARYARALAEVALQNGEESAVRADLDTYREIFRQVPALLDALDSPAVRREAKESVLADLMSRYPVRATTQNFLRVLLSQHRIRYFEEISNLFVKTTDERKGVIAARVSSATPLDADEMSRLSAGLARATGRRVTLTVRPDPDLLAGVVVQIGSTVYDGSVRTQLDEIARRLAGK